MMETRLYWFGPRWVRREAGVARHDEDVVVSQDLCTVQRTTPVLVLVLC